MLWKSAVVSIPQAVQVKRNGPTDSRAEGSAVVLAGRRSLPGKRMIVMTVTYGVLRHYLHCRLTPPRPERCRG